MQEETAMTFARDLFCQVIRNDERPADGCRWIVGDGRPWMVCAAKRATGESYCTEHTARAFRHLVPTKQMENVA
jgi:hypothetical protein